MTRRVSAPAIMSGPLTGALSGSLSRALLGSAVTPSWVVNRANPPNLMFDWTNNRAWNQNTHLLTTAAALITTSRASTAYANDNTNNWTSFAPNVPRITNLGLLVEEARTNGIRNNSNSGAVAGTPGTVPTNVSYTTAPNGLARQIVGFGTDAFGKDYIDVRWSGTATAGQLIFASFDSSTTQIAATNGQTWAQSVWISVVGGTQTNIGTFVLRASMRDAGGTALGGLDQAIALTTTDTRFTNISTTNNASTAFVQPQFLATTAAGAVDITIRFAWPQLELGASVTSPIRTLGSAAVTRAADLVTLTTVPTFGSAYSLYAKGTPQAPNTYSASQEFIDASDGTGGNSARLYRSTGGSSQIAVVLAGAFATGSPMTSAAIVQNTSVKMAGAFAPTDQAGVVNGGTVSPATAASIAAISAINFGSRGGTNDRYANGFLAESAIWTAQRVPNAQLQSMTT